MCLLNSSWNTRGIGEDTGLVTLCPRKAEDSGRVQPAEPDGALREEPGTLHTRLHYDVPKTRSLVEREGDFLGSAGANSKIPILQMGRNTKNW